ncbi:hypothetical protein L218DRAFT_995925 [Marasmius fiardii PR-910]|nr:hypothetical protein L218DRAFT_995925 [Marasmius fiardii PR-910]
MFRESPREGRAHLRSNGTPVQKKSRTSASRCENADHLVASPHGRRRTKRGSLDRLVEDVPLDVVLEIFKHLMPLDLLHLSRTSRALRNILMCRRISRHVWTAARANVVDFPTIPDDMSEAQYASFAFEVVCFACRRGPCESTVWDVRIHCHKNCVAKLFYTRDELKQLKNWSEDVSTMIDRLSGGGPNTTQDCIPCLRKYADGYWNAHRILRADRGYIPSVIKKLRLEYMEVKDDHARLKEWEESQAERYLKRQKWNLQFEQWLRSRRDERSFEIDMVRYQRRVDIQEKLRNMGWGTLDLGDYQLWRHPWVDQAKPLTERSWATMEPRFTELLQEIRTSRSEEQFNHRIGILKGIYTEVRRNLMNQKDQLVIPFVEFILTPEGKDFLNATLYASSDSTVQPIHDQTENRKFSSIVLRLDLKRISKRWLADKEAALRAMLEQKRCSLSTAILKCKNCHDTLWVPRIYGHECRTPARSPSTAVQASRWSWPEYNPFESRFQNYVVWDVENFEYDAARSAFVKQILDLCGASDLRELDAIDPLLECLDCPRGRTLGHRAFYRWQTAVTSHHRYKNAKTHTLSMTIDPETRIRAEKMENEALADTVFLRVDCKLCHSRSPPIQNMGQFGPFQPLRQHMSSSHEVDEAVVQRGIHWTWRTFPRYRWITWSFSPITWVSSSDKQPRICES